MWKNVKLDSIKDEILKICLTEILKNVYYYFKKECILMKIWIVRINAMEIH